MDALRRRQQLCPSWIMAIALTTVALSTFAQAEQIVFVSAGGENKIAVFSIDEANHSLVRLQTVETSGKPASMCVDQSQSHLYVSLQKTKQIAVYSIDSDVRLTLLSKAATVGSPAYLTIDRSGKYLLSSYYGEGKVAIHNIADDGTLSGEPIHSLKTDNRAHSIVLDPLGKFAFVSHTAPQAIFQFRFDHSTGRLTPNDPAKVMREADMGPRHLWFHPSGAFAYGSNEQDCSITMYRFDRTVGLLTPEQTLSSLPEDGYEGKKSTSDIEVHPSGKFVYIANRGHDLIASFKINQADGRLTLLGHTPTETVTRSFNISPDGRYLIAAGQKSGKVAVFHIDEDGTLKRTATLPVGKGLWWVSHANIPGR